MVSKAAMRFGLAITLCFTLCVLIFGPIAMMPTASTEEKIEVSRSNSDVARRLLQKQQIDHEYAVQFETELLIVLAIIMGCFAVGAVAHNSA